MGLTLIHCRILQLFPPSFKSDSNVILMLMLTFLSSFWNVIQLDSYIVRLLLECFLLKYFWLGLLIYNMENPDSIFTFYQYMKPISDNAKGFMYEFDFDDKRKLKGVVWQT